MSSPVLIRCHPLVVIVNTVRCLCLSNACLRISRPRKSLTSPDAEKTSAATQRPGEELHNWQVPYCMCAVILKLKFPFFWHFFIIASHIFRVFINLRSCDGTVFVCLFVRVFVTLASFSSLWAAVTLCT